MTSYGSRKRKQVEACLNLSVRILLQGIRRRPRILIADEPTTALDVTTQGQILNLLRRLQQMAIIFITHDLGVVAQMADSVVIMYLGRIVETGPVKDIFHCPQHPYTKAMLQSVPSVHGEPKTRLESVGGVIPHPLERPSGCPFHNRCPDFIDDRCDRQEPKLQPQRVGHEVSCFLYQ